jgi:hypothetical protein
MICNVCVSDASTFLKADYVLATKVFSDVTRQHLGNTIQTTKTYRLEEPERITVAMCHQCVRHLLFHRRLMGTVAIFVLFLGLIYLSWTNWPGRLWYVVGVCSLVLVGMISRVATTGRQSWNEDSFARLSASSKGIVAGELVKYAQLQAKLEGRDAVFTVQSWNSLKTQDARQSHRSR